MIPTKLIQYVVEIADINDNGEWFGGLLDNLGIVITWSKQDADKVTE